MSKSNLQESLQRVMFEVEKMSPKVLGWPACAADTVNGFLAIAWLPSTIGPTDRTHMSIKACTVHHHMVRCTSLEIKYIP